jgi:hypothetical protein
MGVLFQAWAGIFLYSIASRLALRPTNPPAQWIPVTLSPKINQPGREADHSSPLSFYGTNAFSYTSTPPYISMVRCLIKDRDTFTNYIRSLTVTSDFFRLLS